MVQFAAEDLAERSKRALHPLAINVEEPPQLVPFDGFSLVRTLVVWQAAVPEDWVESHELDESALLDVVAGKGHAPPLSALSVAVGRNATTKKATAHVLCRRMLRCKVSIEMR